MVAADLRDHPSVPATHILVIKNFGPTVARNVAVTFHPPLPDPPAHREHESVTPYLKKRYAKPIPTIVPGMELGNIYFSGRPAPDGGWQNYEPQPDQIRVTIDLDAPDGAHYTDHFDLDVNLIRNKTTAISSGSPVKQRADVVKSNGEIARSLDKLAGGSTKSEPSHAIKRVLSALLPPSTGTAVNEPQPPPPTSDPAEEPQADAAREDH